MTDVRTSSSMLTRFATFAAVTTIALVGFLGTAHYAHAAALSPTSTQYRDTNNDGTVDRFRISFTDVTTCAYEAGDWAIGVAGTVNITSIGGIFNTGTCATDNYIELLIGTTSNITGGAVNPRIDYTNVGTAGSVTADTNQDAANFTGTDGESPDILSAVYLDVNANGTVDAIRYTTSTDTTMVCTAYAGTAAMTITLPGTVGIVKNASDSCATNGTSTFTITLASTGTPNVTGGASSPIIAYVQPGNGLEDAAGNDVPSTLGITVSDGAAPIILSGSYLDSTADGAVDRVRYTTSTDTGMVCTAYSGSAGMTVTAAGTVVIAKHASDTCETTGSLFDILLTTVGAAGTTGGAVSPQVNYNQPGNGLEDGSGNDVPTSATLTLSDAAAPVVMSSTPSSAAAGISRTSTITLVFSEVVASLTTSLSGGVTLTNGGLSTSTVALTGTKIAGANTLTIATAPDAASNAFNRFVATGTTSLSFTVATAGGDTAAAVALTYDVALSAPVAAAAYNAGDSIAITWSTSASTGSVGAVNLDYSMDGGITYTAIVSGTSNDGSYTWTAPDIDAASVTIRAQGTDLITVLATDTSDAFSIGDADTAEDTGDDTEDDSSDDAAEDTDTGADSTTLLPTGTFMKGESWTTVYYVEGTTRRPFLDAQTFFTYADNFDSVIDTSDDYLANYSIGAPMLPAAGSVLIKIVSVNNVYALGEDGELRWISSESVASDLYGSNWADYVIDVAVTAWSQFTFGSDIDSSSDISLDGTEMQTRDALNSK